MLTALYLPANKTIYADHFEDYLKENDEVKRAIVDPFLEKPVFYIKNHFRKNSPVRCHFRSMALSEPSELQASVLFDDEYLKETKKGFYVCNESQEHRDGKVEIATRFIKDMQAEGYTNITVEFEKRILIPSQGNKFRVADVIVTFPGGMEYALECQLSPISTQQLEERTYDYCSAGIDCRWFLGPKARTFENQAFLNDFFGPPSTFIDFAE